MGKVTASHELETMAQAALPFWHNRTSLSLDLVTRRAQPRWKWPQAKNTVPSLAFDIVTRRALAH